MENTVFFVPEPQTDAEHQNAIEQMLAAMQQLILTAGDKFIV